MWAAGTDGDSLRDRIKATPKAVRPRISHSPLHLRALIAQQVQSHVERGLVLVLLGLQNHGRVQPNPGSTMFPVAASFGSGSSPLAMSVIISDAASVSLASIAVSSRSHSSLLYDDCVPVVVPPVPPIPASAVSSPNDSMNRSTVSDCSSYTEETAMALAELQVVFE